VLSSIHANHENIRLSTGQLLEWHRSLYRFTEERGGEWKAKDNAILEVRPDGRQVVRFQPVSALATPEFMDKLLSLFDRAMDKAETDPLLLIATFVFDFECVHPFRDGNGRIGRLLTLLLLYQAGYEVGRLSVLSGSLKRARKPITMPCTRVLRAGTRQNTTSVPGGIIFLAR
jgi:Fic family protein